MMGQALYRKYRSKSLDEIVGQEHITKTLSKAIKSGRISHAYLFTGPRGIGKTSIARILAHEINSLPYNDDSAHLDIIEIDAASNRRIDEIRELREKVYVAPTSAKYKVYIIDEVHMLTREAFNALLKTLEEPPAHVVFVLATTDAHKLPETIISRTQRYIFRPVELPKVTAHLMYIAEQENITISEEAAALLAEHGEGSFRDSISLLDQAAGQNKAIELSDVLEMLGIPPSESIDAIIQNLENYHAKETLLTIRHLYEQGFQAAGIAKQLSAHLRSQFMNESLTIPHATALTLLARLIDVAASHDPDRLLEIVLLEALPVKLNNESYPTKAHIKPQATTTKLVEQGADTIKAKALDLPKSIPKAKHEIIPAKPPVLNEVKTPVNSLNAVFDINLWPQVMGALKKKHNTVYSIARMAQPTINERGTLVLAFAFTFHQKRLNDAKNRQLLADTIQELTGQSVPIECIYDKDLVHTPAQTEVSPLAAEPAPALSTISNIFGGGELLEG